MENKKYNKVITFGTFDLLHIGHVNILRRAKELCDYLIVGVSSDQLNFDKKNKYPVYTENDRMDIVKSIRYVDEVFLEQSLELKRDYIIDFNAEALAMGDDWTGKFDWCGDVCEVLYLPRTDNISTSITKEKIKGIVDL